MCCTYSRTNVRDESEGPMKRSLLLIPVALLGALLTPGQASADDRSCTGLIRAVSIGGSVTVPQGATCTLRGTRIDGNVFVKARATVKVRGATIGGNIQANDHRRVGVTPRKVGDRIVRTRVEGRYSTRRRSARTRWPHLHRWQPPGGAEPTAADHQAKCDRG